MHSLEVIIKRNAEAAGRELGHAVNDGEPSSSLPAERSEAASVPGLTDAGVFALVRAFFHGYNRGREEK